MQPINPSEKSNNERLRTVRILFAAILAAVLIAAVCTAVWFIRRDTPEKAIRNTMKQISSPDGSLISELTLQGNADKNNGVSESALLRFFSDFSCRILSVSQDGDHAQAQVSVTTPDARLIATDIRLYLLKNADAQEQSETGQVYTLLDRFLSENEYPPAETEGIISLSRTRNSWTIQRDEELSSLLLGGLPDALTDPYLLTPEQVLRAYMEKLDSMSVREWSETFNVNDLFSTYAPEYEQIDTEFLTRAKEAYAYSDIHAETSGTVSEVSTIISGIDSSAIFRSFKQKLSDYGVTIDAITDDSSALSEKSAQFLLEAIRENESTADYPVTVSMENNGNGWIITDSSSLTDALFGGMSAAVSQFEEDPDSEE